MATVLTAPIRAALQGTALGHLVTLNEDGSPQVTVVWVGLDGDQIVTGHLQNRKKVRNVRRDPRVTLSLETGGHDERGLAEYLVVNGAASVTEGGAPQLLQELAHTYLGPDVRFPDMDDPPDGFVLHITPESVKGIGPWSESA
jgi:PPOX class probable F420-dependent enzyme